MAYLGTWGILLLLLLGLIVIIVLLHKEKAGWALALSVFLIIFIPIWLDQVILNKWYIVLPMESARTADEWMDFLGSYLGVVGTIVAGALAYWQTRVNREQDKEIEKQKQDIEDQNQEIRRLQAQIAAYQILPSVNFRDGTAKVYAGSRRQETNRVKYGKIYYSLSGTEPPESLMSFACIRIPFREKGLVPIEEICIKRMEWAIAGRTYAIRPADGKYALMNGEVQILIDSGDVITEPDTDGATGQMFIDEILIHQENSLIGKYNFDKSRLTIELEFINQIAKPRTYKLDYFIYSNEKAEKLFLKKPHVSIVEENNGNRNDTRK